MTRSEFAALIEKKCLADVAGDIANRYDLTRLFSNTAVLENRVMG